MQPTKLFSCIEKMKYREIVDMERFQHINKVGSFRETAAYSRRFSPTQRQVVIDNPEHEDLTLKRLALLDQS